MANRKSKSKIVKYRRFPLLHMNIGTVLFGIIFLYMVICLVLYLTSSHVTAYEVTEGFLSGNYRYTAIALKSELVVNATQSGSVTYYAREGSKVGNGGAVCSIDESSASTASKDTSSDETEAIDSESAAKFRSSIAAFASNYDQINFQNVYDFQADMETGILEMNGDPDQISEVASGLVNLCSAPQEGIVIYSTDQFEDKEVKDLTAADFSQHNYEKTNLRLQDTVKTGDPVYKLITDENWSLIINLDKKTAAELGGKDTVRIRFLKDGTMQSASFSVYQNGTSYYGKLDLSSSVTRFSSDRYVDIELMLNRNTGLKIPVSAIAEREFYTIPTEYVIYDEDSPNEVRVLKETKTKDGTTNKYVTATVFDKTEDDFMVDASLFEEGDTILMKDSSKRYTISEKVSMQGVYNINKGYAVFREITIIDENEEYCIVEDGAAFGLAQYDHIALDASTVTDEQIIY